jgi:YD repeat-containing protein
MIYDLTDNLTTLTDPLGREAHYAYDEAGNLTTTRYGRDNTLYAASASGQVLTLGYLTSTGKDETHYSWDLHRNLTSVESPDGSIERFVYDAAGRLTEKVKPSGATIHYDYDVLGHLLTKDYEERMEATTYAYDSFGNRLSMTDESGESTYTYDEAGRLITHTQADGRALSYTYDSYGRMATLTYPDEHTATYTYDLADNIVEVEDSLTGTTLYTYDAEGRVLSCTRPDGTETLYTYDALGNLTELVNSREDTVLSSFTYTYDALGRIATEEAFQEVAGTGADSATDKPDQDTSAPRSQGKARLPSKHWLV